MKSVVPGLTELAIKHHPQTGEVIRPLWIRPDGRMMWPIMGGAPDDGGDGGAGGGAGGDGGQGGGTGGSGTGTGGGGAGSTANATDGQGNDLGYPKDTPVAEMTAAQQAAYWKHNSRRHEGRFKDIVGDKTPEQIKADLAELAELKKQQLTPAEQALTDQYEKGKAEGISAERRQAATAIFRGALEANGITGDDLTELSSTFNVDAFIGDNGVDTTKIANFAKRFAPAGTGGTQRQRDFGAGRRQQGTPERGAGGKAEAARRFGKKTTTDA